MYKALKSFSGLVNMTKNELKEIKDKAIAEDLLRAGYIEKVKEETKNTKAEVKKDIEKVVDKVEEVVDKVEKKVKKVSKKAKK